MTDAQHQHDAGLHPTFLPHPGDELGALLHEIVTSVIAKAQSRDTAGHLSLEALVSAGLVAGVLCSEHVEARIFLRQRIRSAMGNTLFWQRDAEYIHWLREHRITTED